METKEGLEVKAHTKKFFAQFNRLLAGTDPFYETTDRSAYETNMCDVLRTIQEYVTAAYLIQANPLPHLRKNLPAFTWEHHRPETEDAVKRIVQDVDYALLALVNTDWSAGIVVAKEIKGKNRRKICYWERDFPNAVANYYWPLDELRTIGARFLTPEVSIAPSDAEITKPMTYI